VNEVNDDITDRQEPNKNNWVTCVEEEREEEWVPSKSSE
jgi:hypothetical protein